MKEAKRNLYLGILIFIIFNILGVFLLYRPLTTYDILAKILATVLFILSVIYFYRFFSIYKDNKDKKFDISLVYGIISFLIGIIFLVFTNLTKNILPILLGLIMIINGLGKFYLAKNIKDNKQPIYKLAYLMIFILLLLGLCVIFASFSKIFSLNQLVAIFLVSYSTNNLLLAYLYHLVIKDYSLIIIKNENDYSKDKYYN